MTKYHKFYNEIDDQTTDNKSPVIYIIEYGEGNDFRIYIGKAKGGTSRPLNTYRKCVQNYEEGKQRVTYKKINGDWHKVGSRNAWRDHVHRPLSEARKAGVPIKLTMFNVAASELDSTEDQMILDAFYKYGGERMLNRDGIPTEQPTPVSEA